jgi:uncharacterized membrane protein
MYFPSDEIMKDLGWFLVILGGPLLLDFEIIEPRRLAGLDAIGIASLIP